MLKYFRTKNEFDPSVTGIFFNKFYLIRRGIAEAVRDHAPALSGSLLDYGCGSRPYEHLFSVSEYVAVDVADSGHPSYLKRADVYFDGESLPFGENRFDAVFASEVFEHVFDLKACLSDIHRVLKPGGKLLVTCPFVWPLHEEPFDFARYTPHALRFCLEQAGFEIESLEQKGSQFEVIGQLFLESTAPHLFPKIPKIFGLYMLVMCGVVSSLCRFLSKILSSDKKLFLTNVILATKRIEQPDIR